MAGVPSGAYAPKKTYPEITAKTYLPITPTMYPI